MVLECIKHSKPMGVITSCSFQHVYAVHLRKDMLNMEVPKSWNPFGRFMIVLSPWKINMGVSENSGFSSKSSILIWISITNLPFWGILIFWKHPHGACSHHPWKEGNMIWTVHLHEEMVTSRENLQGCSISCVQAFRIRGLLSLVPRTTGLICRVYWGIAFASRGPAVQGGPLVILKSYITPISRVK